MRSSELIGPLWWRSINPNSGSKRATSKNHTWGFLKIEGKGNNRAWRKIDRGTHRWRKYFNDIQELSSIPVPYTFSKMMNKIRFYGKSYNNSIRKRLGLHPREPLPPKMGNCKDHLMNFSQDGFMNIYMPHSACTAISQRRVFSHHEEIKASL